MAILTNSDKTKASYPSLISRWFTNTGDTPKDVFDSVAWGEYDVEIVDQVTGKSVFFQEKCVFPVFYSETARKIIASKYFKNVWKDGELKRERSLKELISRVVKEISEEGKRLGYFTDDGKKAFEKRGHSPDSEKNIFAAELTYILLNQLACFNSPVWFNVGVNGNQHGWYYDYSEKKCLRAGKDRPQVSACFILGVEDSMESILNWYHDEGMIFKHGSGSGVNLSKIRSSCEHMSGGGKASGPVSFMKAADISASTIKSGGKHRRAAKMVVLDVEHPDILDFIRCKAEEEKKARILIEAGYSPRFNEPNNAYEHVFYQNANHSVRVTDSFMRAVERNEEWWTVLSDGTKREKYRARDIFEEIAKAAHFCADPGIQYHDTTNRWNVCADTEPIRASNPCSEYVFLDDTACNLASINLMKFWNDAPYDKHFDCSDFEQTVKVMITAQDILVDIGAYPTEKIAMRSHEYRTLGLGYSNLGALILSLGIPYDSDEARNLAASITSLMTAFAYDQSCEIAASLSPFPKYSDNKSSAVRVIEQHATATRELLKKATSDIVSPVLRAASEVWERLEQSMKVFGLRNAQVTVLAPTGTISFMMDCETTGVEPELALVKYKSLVGGGTLKLVNPLINKALTALNYPAATQSNIVELISSGKDFSHEFTEEELKVFDTSFPNPATGRFIHYMGHLKMMAAVQPFLSGAISKTVNLPNSATVDDIKQIYMEAWKMGLKCVSVYRDGCKGSQPLTTKLNSIPAGESAKQESQKTIEKIVEVPVGLRKKLPDTRSAVTHRFQIGSHDGYFTVGLYEDGSPGEIFITMAKEGSTVSGLMDWCGIVTSMALQWGVPVEVIVSKLKGMQFEPSGFSHHPDIRFARSVADYLARWLEVEFLNRQQTLDLGIQLPVVKLDQPDGATVDSVPHSVLLEEVRVPGTQKAPGNLSLPPCPSCGSIMVPNGSCHKCTNCGETSGCS